MSEYQYSVLLREKTAEKGLSLERLSEMANVPLPHLEMLVAGRFEYLPAAPYVHGYVRSLGKVLNYDANEWWMWFKRGKYLVVAGVMDELPANRFAKKTPSRAIVIAGGLFGIFMIFLLVRFSAIVGKPRLSIIYPVEDATVVKENKIIIRGIVERGDKLSVNKEDVPMKEGEMWEKEIGLTPGINTIQVSASKLLGWQINRIYRVIFEPPAEVLGNTPAPSPQEQPFVAGSSSATSTKTLPEPDTIPRSQPTSGEGLLER
jgi:hypothetical protein